jgi:hypothetical protein
MLLFEVCKKNKNDVAVPCFWECFSE